MLDQHWAVGMIERGTNRVWVQEVERRNWATLWPIIEQHVAPDSIIVSDGWAAYNGLDNQPTVNHRVVIHERNFVDPHDPQVHTQSIEATWSAVCNRYVFFISLIIVDEASPAATAKGQSRRPHGISRSVHVPTSP
jgi:hypothetical protein